MKSFKEDNKPSLQFYPDDWLSEPGLNICSLAAQGLWIKMICIMWKADIRGCLKANGKQIDSKSLAKLSGVTEEEVSKLLKELGDNNVYSTLEDGTIYSRRLYREASRERELREVRSGAGRLGGLAKGKQKPSKRGSKKVAKQAAPTPSPTSTPNTSPNSDEFRLAKLLFELIRLRKPNFKKPDLEKWATHIDRLIRLDKRTPEQIEKIIQWCQMDGFWQNNILSTEKLRKQIDQLELKAGKNLNQNTKIKKLEEKAEACNRNAGTYCVFQNQKIEEDYCKYCSRFRNLKQEET